MADEKHAPQERTEVIALPPLKMVLVHAKDERENALTAVIKSAEPQERVQTQALKKIIEHLEKKDSS
ncbi:MAG: hypothetical protein HYZ21_15835 [Chloroflexi bacterium]|nr:hypothetical protein [Chloroflexota bacterium]